MRRRLKGIRKAARAALTFLVAASCALPAGAVDPAESAGTAQTANPASTRVNIAPHPAGPGSVARAEKPPLIGDVRLHANDVFMGQVVTRDYVPVEGRAVALINANRVLGAAKTDARGFFAFRGLENGVYQVAVNEDRMAYRVWTAQTAPPAAHAGALIVVEDDVVRGQQEASGHVLKAALNNPFIVGGVIAAAIAVPIAVHNARDEGPATP